MTAPPAFASPSFTRVVRGLVALHRLIADGQGDSPEAEAARDALDAPLAALSGEEKERARWLSEDLYAVADDVRGRMTGPGITEISLDCGPCFGTCPVFSVKLTLAGSYRYEGSGYVEPLGERKGTFPGYLFERLAEVCGDLGILSLNDVYPSDFDDTSVTVVTVRHAVGAKKVTDQGGGQAPARFWAFGVLIEHAMREAWAIEDRKAARGNRRQK